MISLLNFICEDNRPDRAFMGADAASDAVALPDDKRRRTACNTVFTAYGEAGAAGNTAVGDEIAASGFCARYAEASRSMRRVAMSASIISR